MNMIGDALPGGGNNNDDTSTSMTATAAQPPMKSPESPSTSSPLASQTAGSSLPGSPGSGTSQIKTPTVVVFDPRNAQVFDLSKSFPEDTIFFSLANTTVVIDKLGWYVVDPGSLRQIGSSSETNPTMLSLGATRSVDKGVTLNFKSFQSNNSDDFGEVMILAVNWNVNGISGFTSSPAFSVVRLSSEVSATTAKLNSSPYSVSNETFSGSDSVDSTISSSSTESHAGGVPTMMPTSTPTVSSGSSHSRSGLSTGAIAGIAVGVGVAALLAAAMGLFFFLRRRRRDRDGSGRHGASGAQEKLSSLMVVPKDVNANVSDPAITPYRDEQNHQAVAAAGGAAAETRVLEEDDDEAAPLDQSDRRRAVPASRTGAAAATEPHQGVSRHLVEDGMTDDEIRRLEEEERQLDDEIQRAGGRN